MHPYRVRYRIVQHDDEDFTKEALAEFYGEWTTEVSPGVFEGIRVVYAVGVEDAIAQVKHNEQARMELGRRFCLQPGTVVYVTYIEPVELLDDCDPRQPESWIRLGASSQEMLRALYYRERHG